MPMRGSDSDYGPFASSQDVPRSVQTLLQKGEKGFHCLAMNPTGILFFFQPKLLREILNCFPIHLSHEVPLFLTQDESDLSKSSLYPLSAWLRARCQVWSKDYFFAQRLQHSIWGRIALLDCKAQTRKAQNFVMGVFLWLVRNAASTRSTD